MMNPSPTRPIVSQSASSQKAVAPVAKASNRLDAAKQARPPATTYRGAVRSVRRPAERDRQRQCESRHREQVTGLGRPVSGDVLHEHRHQIGRAEQPQAIGEGNQQRRAEAAGGKQAHRQQRRSGTKLPDDKAAGQRERDARITERGHG